MNHIYQPWGFVANPFNSEPLRPDARGEQLLIGRDEELAKISRRLYTPPQCVTIEGPNGIGKTSIANVAAYTALRRFLEGQSSTLLLPCTRTFQIKPATQTDVFVDEVFFEIAQSILSHVPQLRNKLPHLRPRLDDIEKIGPWLQTPMLTSRQGGIEFLGLGASFGSQTQPNSSPGFSRSGFQSMVRQWLGMLFPEQSGGVVCIIDNLELLQTSKEARQRLEELRDLLLSVPGIRWVLSGAAGIVNAVLSTPRLMGYLYDPIPILGLGANIAPRVYQSRLDAYGDPSTRERYMPLVSGDFGQIFWIFRGNLRSALGEANRYCMAAADTNQRLHDDGQKAEFFKGWLEQRCQALVRDINGRLSQREWQIFAKTVELEQAFSLQDHDLFNCDSPQNLGQYVQALEDVTLLRKSIDQEDRRRKTIEVTENGWLVAHAKGYGGRATSLNG